MSKLLEGSGESFPTSNPTEMISKPLTERRRDAMYQSDLKTLLLEEAEKHVLISQEIRVPSDDPEDQYYEFEDIPLSPNDQNASMSEKQDAPRGSSNP